ncbi:MAG: hypothetical protein H0X38_01335 [Planctomycetes bacterium]|nr:hypothetical protein [Planctomycetota bacterium]
MPQPAQSYATHRRLPPIHIAAGAILVIVLGWNLWQARQGDTAPLLGALLLVALLIVWHNSRRNAQIMQDRIIRLEMQVRLARLLPAERHGEIARLTLPQLVGLRFAGDAELPALVQKTLAENLSNNAIKRLVTDWQPDWLRV